MVKPSMNSTGRYIDLIGNELAKATQLNSKVKLEAMAGKSYQRVLAELLEQLKPVSFRAQAKLAAEAKLSKSTT